MLLAAALLSLSSGELVWVRVAGYVEILAVVGLAGAFAVHEVAHVAVLRRCGGVSGVVMTATPWRFSLEPRGVITHRQVAAVAVAGPAAATGVGLVLWVGLPQAALHWWFIAHLVFLLPIFGDGRSLVLALRREHSPDRHTGG